MRSSGVLVLAGLLLVAGAVVGVVLVWPGDDPGTTWDHYRVVGDGLVVHKLVSSCDGVTGAEVSESDERVEVTLFVDQSWVWCAADAVDGLARVERREPLGDRPVYDGACLARRLSEGRCLRESGRGFD